MYLDDHFLVDIVFIIDLHTVSIKSPHLSVFIYILIFYKGFHCEAQFRNI